MGKWDHVVKNLPPELPVDAKFQEKVDVVKRPLIGNPASGLAQKYALLRDEKKELETSVKELNVKIAATEQALWNAFEDEGVSSLKLAEGGGSVRIGREPVASVKDKDALRNWAMTNGHERDLTLPWQKLQAVSKSLIEAGEATPEGVDLAVRTKTVYSKG